MGFRNKEEELSYSELEGSEARKYQKELEQEQKAMKKAHREESPARFW